jgi:hypothetical protein
VQSHDLKAVGNTIESQKVIKSEQSKESALRGASPSIPVVAPN